MSTLAQLFRPGQYIRELDDADFGELMEIVLEEAETRGYEAIVNETTNELAFVKFPEASETLH